MSGGESSGRIPPIGKRFQPGVSGNPKGRPPNPPESIVMMAQKASPEIMRWMIGVATGKIKGISADLRVKVGLAVHERAYGRPPAIVAVDVALRRAVESSDPAEQLRILRDMRAAYIAEVAQLAAPVDAEYEVVEDGPPTDSDGAGDAAKESE